MSPQDDIKQHKSQKVTSKDRTNSLYAEFHNSINNVFGGITEAVFYLTYWKV